MRETIIQAAMEQILRVGLRKFTVEDVTTELGMSKKTIYKYFASKNEMISAVVDSVLEKERLYTEGVMRMDGSIVAKMDALMFFHAGNGVPTWVVDELRRYYPEEYKKREGIQAMKREYFNQLLAEGVETGDIHADVRPGVLNMIVKQSVDGILDGDFLRSHDLSLTQAIEQLKQIIFYGIMTGEGKRRK